MFRNSLLTIALVASAFGKARAAATCPSPSPSALVRRPPIVVRAPGAALELRVADTVDNQSYGLMCVTALPRHEGMIFVFPGGDQSRSFWMKNTLIPLDMVFVRSDGRVSSVAARVPATTVATPDEDVPTRLGVGEYVIELAAGEAAADGITTGTELDVRRAGKAKS